MPSVTIDIHYMNWFFLNLDDGEYVTPSPARSTSRLPGSVLRNIIFMASMSSVPISQCLSVSCMRFGDTSNVYPILKVESKRLLYSRKIVWLHFRYTEGWFCKTEINGTIRRVDNIPMHHPLEGQGSTFFIGIWQHEWERTLEFNVFPQ